MSDRPIYRSGPRNPMSHERMLAVCHAYKVLYENYLRVGGKLTSELFEMTLVIEREIAHWETRSARLRYEAKRQAQYRANKAVGQGHNRPMLDPSLEGDDFSGDFEQTDQTEIDPIIPAATREALEKWRKKGGGSNQSTSDLPDGAPDTSNYRKSGLV